MLSLKASFLFLLIIVFSFHSLTAGISDQPLFSKDRKDRNIQSFSRDNSVMIIPIKTQNGYTGIDEIIVTTGNTSARQRREAQMPARDNELPFFSLSDEQGKVLYETQFSFPAARTVPMAQGGRSDGSPDVIPITEPEAYLVVPYFKEAKFIDIYSPFREIQGASYDLAAIPTSFVFRPRVKQNRDSISGMENLSGAKATSKFYILVIASGYTSGQMSTFNSKADSLKTYLLSKQPFSNYSANIVINRYGNTTSLGCACGCSGISRLMCCTSSKVLSAAAASGYKYDEIIVLHNTSTYCGGGYRDNNNSYKVNSYNTYTMIYSGTSYKSMGLHEFGHSFGNLCDEYSYGSEGYTYYPCVNCRAACSDWSSISSTCTVGCDAKPSYYRPQDSIMLSLSLEYYNTVSINAAYSPDGLNLRLNYFTNR